MIAKKVILTMLLGTGALALKAQVSAADQVTAAFNHYQLQHFQEKIFAHVNKDFFIAGETIWFRLYDLDGFSNKSVSFSTVSYVELIGVPPAAAVQTKVRMEYGAGKGSLVIPASLPSGKYLFRAYSSWMRNFSPALYFSQSITIVNTQAEHLGVAPSIDKPAMISLFPEGGNLVAGLPSVIGVECKMASGQPIAVSGAILNQRGDTVARFRTGESGLGHFAMTPSGSDNYTALWKYKDSLIRQPLPAVFPHGYVMSVSNNNQQVTISVQWNQPDANPAVYLFSVSNGMLQTAGMKNMQNGSASFSVDQSNLTDGINHFILFNGEKQPVCQRTYYKSFAAGMHLQQTPDKTDYGTRAPVSIDIQSTDSAGKALSGDLSLSIFHLDSLQTVPEQNINNWVSLQSAFDGRIDHPGLFLNDADPVAKENLNDLMLTKGWSRFKWEDIMSNNPPAFSFLPELEGPLITGRIRDKKTGMADAGKAVTITVPGAYFESSHDVSRTDGGFRAHASKVYGDQNVIVQTDSNDVAEIESPFDIPPAEMPVQSMGDLRSLARPLLQRSMHTQLANAFRASYIVPATPVAADTTGFYGKPDKTYNLDDYTRFNTMEEMIRENMTELRVRIGSGNSHLYVLNPTFNLFFEQDPLILLDGVPVTDFRKILAEDPLKIHLVDIINEKYLYNNATWSGVVAFKTYHGDLSGYELNPNDIVVEYEGLQRQQEFYAPTYATEAAARSSIPDLRNALYWNPQIITGPDGKQSIHFYTSDLKGKFAIVLQGISKGGKTGYSQQTISVH